MSYLVLARKWRPKTFADLVGQEHVAQTLRNAIAQDRVAHAFLFTGARGVGKTTIARIMARTLNCLKRDGTSPDPCLECPACIEIASGRDPDVQEIDGASNNGVDDVRRLQETLPYRPQRDRFKVVIIDEVHMLSTGAFNALLKTLEEPPAHVKFIFATTEVHKVLPTILSRVQRYDFRLIPTQKIRERLAYILKAEGFTYDDTAVALIAREAAGSMRDALSLLDQVLAGVQGELTGVQAAKLLGVADRKVLYDLVRAMLAGDAPAAVKMIDAIGREGYDLPNVAKSLLSVIRDLVIARVVPDPDELLDLADEERGDIQVIASKSDPLDLERLFVAWAKVTEDVARTREPRWTLEMAVVRLSHRPALLPAEELMSRLAEMEKRLSSGSPAPASPARPSAPSAPAAAPAQGASPPTPTATPQRFSAPQRSSTDPTPRASGDRPAPTATAGAAVAAQATVRAAPIPAPRIQPQAQATVTPAPAQKLQPPPAPQEPRLDVTASPEALETWRRVVEGVEGNLVSVLKEVVPLEVTATQARLAIDALHIFRKKLATPEAQEIIAEAIARVVGAKPKVEVIQGALPDHAMSLARVEEAARQEARRQRENAAKTHPLVKAVCEVLGAEVARVRLDGDPT